MRTADRPTPGSPADLQPEADPEQVARTILLRRLTAAPRSRADLRADLVKRGIPEEVADRVLDRFEDVGLIDDAEFARLWVESRHRSRGAARSVLRQELRNKGITDDDAGPALGQIDGDAERERAVRLVQDKSRALSRVEPAVRTRRLVSMLQRRGYSAGLAYAVVREVVGELASDGDGDA
jgi:regulatory protein